MNSMPPGSAPKLPMIVAQASGASGAASGSASSPREASVGVVPRISSDQLFPTGAVELIIDHRGSLYRLKQTSLGKLILTK